MDENQEIGTVKWYDTRKGYGFIVREDGDEIFVHYSQILEPGGSLDDGDRVTFVVGPGRKGEAAHKVSRLEE